MLASRAYVTREGRFQRAFLILASLLPFLLFFQAFPNYRNPNELSRFLLTSAIVDDGTTQIDRALERFGPCQDVSFYNGHYYSNKAIGYSLLAVPFYFLVARIAGVSDYDAILYILKLFLNLIPLLFFTGLLFRCFAKDLGLGHRSYALLAAFLFGTLVFPYAQMFASHLLTGLLWFASLYLVVHHEKRGLAFLGGALLGASFLLEIPSILMIPVFFLWLFIYKRSLLMPFVLGCVLLSIPALVYNAIVFGAPWNWSYKFVVTEELRAVHDQGYVGVSPPSPWIFWQLTFGSNRGFFYFQPFLVFGIAGLAAAFKHRKEAWLVLTMILVNLLFYSGYASWDGGWSFGPRFLVPLVPLLIYGCALYFQRSSGFAILFYILLGITIPGMLMGSATFLLSPRFLGYILQWQVPALFWGGFFGLNWGDLFGLSDTAIQLLAILLLYGALTAFLMKSALNRRQWAAILVPSFLLLFGSALFQSAILTRMPAAHDIAIGRIGYIQGHYAKSLAFLKRGRNKTTNPALLGEANRWIALCEEKTRTR